MRRRLNLTAVPLVVFALVAVARGASSPQGRCLSAKLKAIARKEAGLLSCFAKVAAKGRATTLGACVQKVHGRYVAAFTKAGSCGGDDITCECLAENCAIDVRLALPDAGPSRCESARLKAALREAARMIGCNARGAAKGLIVDQACIRKAQTKYRGAFARATGCTGDQTTVETIVGEKCVAEVGADPIGGGTVSELCTSHACDGVDARPRSGAWPGAAARMP